MRTASRSGRTAGSASRAGSSPRRPMRCCAATCSPTSAPRQGGCAATCALRHRGAGGGDAAHPGQLPAQARPGRRAGRRPRSAASTGRLRGAAPRPLSERQHQPGNLLLPGRRPRRRPRLRPPAGAGDRAPLPPLAADRRVRQRPLRTRRERPGGEDLLRAADPGAAARTQQPDRRRLLPRALHEPLPVGLGPGGKEAPLHGTLPPGAQPQPAAGGGQAARGGDHHQQPGGAAQRLQHQPRQ